MKYHVWHAKNPTFGFGVEPKFPEGYELVALITSESLNDTFRITNHIDKAWTSNPEVIDIYKNQPRSTSVGDVVVDANGNANRCESMGWKTITI